MTQPWIFGREQEIAVLRQRLARGRNLLVHGPTGVGKTLLLRAILPELPAFLYCEVSTTIHTVFRNIACELWRAGSARVRSSCGKAGLEGLKAKSAANLKGVVLTALREGEYRLVLDHVNRPSAPFAAVVREIVVSCDTPVTAVAHSAHMEDVGFLQPFFGDRADRYELRNFAHETASAFANEVVSRIELKASNARELLDRVVEYSEGNPGAIILMLQMGKALNYRIGDNIKLSTLYIDFRLGWRTAPE